MSDTTVLASRSRLHDLVLRAATAGASVDTLEEATANAQPWLSELDSMLRGEQPTVSIDFDSATGEDPLELLLAAVEATVYERNRQAKEVSLVDTAIRDARDLIERAYVMITETLPANVAADRGFDGPTNELCGSWCADVLAFVNRQVPGIGGENLRALELPHGEVQMPVDQDKLAIAANAIGWALYAPPGHEGSLDVAPQQAEVARSIAERVLRHLAVHDRKVRAAQYQQDVAVGLGLIPEAVNPGGS